MAEHAEPADETTPLELLRGPLGVALVSPGALEAGDLLARRLEVVRAHVLEVLGLRIDLGQRLRVLRPPAAEEQPVRPDFVRNGHVRPAAYQARALSEKGPVGEPRRRKQASRSAACRSASSDAQYAPEGASPEGNGDQ